MVEFRRIQMTLFVLLLQFTAVTGQTLLFITRAGDEVTLPSDHLIENQDNCNSTAWLFSRSSGATAEELINLGRINNDVISRDKSNRLSLTANCSLVIRNVTDDDIGHYTCRQYNKSGREQGPDVQVELSVLNIEEQKFSDTVGLSCSVFTNNRCGHTVEWLYEGQKNDVETYQRTCEATVIFKPSHLNQKSKYYELLKCKVTDGKSGNTLLFDVCSQFSCEKTGSTSERNNDTSSVNNATPTKPGSTSSAKNNTSSVKNDTPAKPESTSVGKNNTSSANNDTLDDMSVRNKAPNRGILYSMMWLIIVSVGLAALLILTVFVIIRKKTKGNRGQMDESIGLSSNRAVTHPVPETSQDVADPEEGVSYTSVSYTKKTNSEAQVLVKDYDDADDAVTDSTVNAPSSSSAGASADLSNLYASVNKPNK